MGRTLFIDLPQKSDEVFIRIFTNAGRLSESPQNQGIGHLLDHYINGRIFQQNFNINTNAHINRDFLWFSLNTNKKNCLRDAAKFLQYVLNPDFSDKALLDFERQALANELKSEAATAYNSTFKKTLSWKFSGYPNVYNEIDKVHEIDLTSLEEHHKLVFSDYRLTIFVGGNKLGRLKKDIRAVIEASLNKDMSNPLSYRHLVPSTKFRQGFTLASGDQGQAFVYFVARSFSYNEPVEKRITATIILRELTSRTKNSPFLALRKMGVYGLHFNHAISKNVGFIVLSAVCGPEVANDVVRIVQESIKNYVMFGVTKAAIARHRKGQWEYYCSLKNNNGDFFSHIVDDYLFEGETTPFSRAMKQWEVIDPEYVKMVATEIFADDSLSIVTHR